MNRRSLLAALLLPLFLSVAPPTPAAVTHDADVDEPIVLVATAALESGPYEQSVLLALPGGRGLHFGFVLNRLTEVSIEQLFPDERVMARMKEHVYAGGPSLGDRLFALVRGPRDDNPDLLEVGRDLFLATKSDDVDRILADRNRDARFYVGMVLWGPGELEAELQAGAWDVLESKRELVLAPEPDQQWRRLTALAHALQAAVQLHSTVPRLFARY